MSSGAFTVSYLRQGPLLNLVQSATREPPKQLSKKFRYIANNTLLDAKACYTSNQLTNLAFFGATNQPPVSLHKHLTIQPPRLPVDWLLTTLHNVTFDTATVALRGDMYLSKFNASGSALLAGLLFESV
jgi:hypothetical protein